MREFDSLMQHHFMNHKFIVVCDTDIVGTEIGDQKISKILLNDILRVAKATEGLTEEQIDVFASDSHSLDTFIDGLEKKINQFTISDSKTLITVELNFLS